MALGQRMLCQILKYIPTIRYFRVQGQSMGPALQEGDFVLTRALLPWEKIGVGEIVIVKDPRNLQRLLIKRVTALRPASCVLGGDNGSFSTDSRAFGPIPLSCVREKMFLRIAG